LLLLSPFLAGKKGTFFFLLLFIGFLTGFYGNMVYAKNRTSFHRQMCSRGWTTALRMGWNSGCNPAMPRTEAKK